MPRVVLQMSVTLDGYVAGPGGELDWGLPAEDPDARAWKLESLGQVGTHIMGRVTYEQMAEHWPNATGDYAAFMNNLAGSPKRYQPPIGPAPELRAATSPQRLLPSRANPAARSWPMVAPRSFRRYRGSA
jgi:dihydrofolate reductase